MSYLPASFRGVPFDVLADGLSYPTGRRTVVHELPYRDTTITEDLGTAFGPITLTAVLSGPGYELRRDLLLSALDEPGPGILIHPTRGRLTVVAEPSTVSESANVVTLALTFRESGSRSYPTVSADASAVDVAASALRAAAAASFAAALDVTGAAHVLTDALSEAAEAVDTIRQAATAPAAAAVSSIGAVVRALTRLDTDLSELINSPLDLMDALEAALAPAESLSFVRLATAGAGAADRTAQTADPSADQIAANATAIHRAVTAYTLATYAEVAAAQDYSSYDDAIVVRDELALRLGAEAEYTTDADAYAALTGLRADIVDVLSDLAVVLPRLRTVTVDATASVLELAQDLYGDGLRAEEIALRNDVAHPGLLPPGTYRVLSS